jgi:3D (Asp-Asp-Asp) domain-containing protein
MNRHFSAARGLAPAVCLSFLLHLGIQAQSLTPPANQDEAKQFPAPVEPKVGPAQPALDFAAELLPQGHEITLDLLDLGGPDRSNHRAFEATAYSLRGRTASGVPTQPGVIAADPRVLPLGSVVHVRAGQYSGVYTVHDTGSRVKGNLVDVWVPSSREARSFGRRQVKLQVLRLGSQRQKSKR